MTGFHLFTLAALFAATVLFGGVWAFQNYGVYHFDQTPQSPENFGLAGVEVLDFTSEDGTAVQAWWVAPAPGKPVLFSFYGNFSAIGPSMQRLGPLMADGTGVVMLHYRGAGGRSGQPSEEGFARDARALYDQLDGLTGQVTPPDIRVVQGSGQQLLIQKRPRANSRQIVHPDRPRSRAISRWPVPRRCSAKITARSQPSRCRPTLSIATPLKTSGVAVHSRG